jgi:hypothetical protein
VSTDTRVEIGVPATRGRLGLRVGDAVEVRSAEEILATLDARGELDGLPFMPEMLEHCGRRFTVHKVALKLCDTVTGTGMRRMRDAVHLDDVRCDGGAHGGCQTACLVYWKEAWLTRAGGTDGTAAPPPPLPDLDAATRRPPGPDGEERYACQATELLRAAPERLPLRDLGQYARDVRSGNAGVGAVVRSFLVGVFNHAQGVSVRRLPPRLRVRRGLRWGFVEGSLRRTPTLRTDLRPGELVRVRSKAEIMGTLNGDRLNRGMGFEEEMARHCGREARVLRRVDRCIDEATGRLLHMRNPCIVLEDTVCEGAYNATCPRSIPAFWREIWLERVGEPPGGGPA